VTNAELQRFMRSAEEGIKVETPQGLAGQSKERRSGVYWRI